MREEDLIGIWSEDRRHSPAAQSDVDLAFLPDGRGFLEFTNAVFDYIEAFKWSMSASGMLTISGTASYEVDRQEREARIDEGPGSLHFEDLPIRIERENTPRGERMEVLTVDEGNHGWKNCLAGRLVPEKYGITRRRFEDYKLPAFFKP